MMSFRTVKMVSASAPSSLRRRYPGVRMMSRGSDRMCRRMDLPIELLLWYGTKGSSAFEAVGDYAIVESDAPEAAFDGG